MLRVLFTVGLAFLAGAVRAGPEDGVKTVRLEVTPAKPTAPVLHHPLLPDLREQKSGNAAPLYRNAGKTLNGLAETLADRKWHGGVARWLELPLDQFPRPAVHAFIRHMKPVYDEVETAARREFCDWELLDKFRAIGLNVPLNEVSEVRDFGNLFALRQRLALAEDRLDDALRDTQTMFVLARHVNGVPTLLCVSVASALGYQAAGRLEEFMQHPGAPNLSWSLVDLPRPFLDMRPAFQGDRMVLQGTFPGLAELLTDRSAGVMTTEQLAQAGKLLAGLEIDDPRLGDAVRLRFAFDVQRKHETSKRALIAAGWSAEQVERMPHLQVALLHAVNEVDRWFDDVGRWHNLPYWEAAPALLDAEVRRRKTRPGPNDPAAYSMLRLFAASSGQIYYNRARFERRLAALRCIEGLRLYAAAHDGTLPAALDDVKDVPIPIDPLTGRAFEYHRDGANAILSAPAVARPVPGRVPDPRDALRYAIVVRR